jgi:branched-chain amino acid transport system substrate-binding protein
MWQTMEQQGVFEQTTVTTGLAERATWDFYGPAASEIAFLNHYFPGGSDNDPNTFMVDNYDADLFSPDGFAAAQMIVRAIEEAGPDDVAGMIAALEGWSFDGPKGPMTIRASDHALLQPMYAVQLVETDGGMEAELVDTLSPEATAPPEG